MATKDEIARARTLLNDRWQDSGECRSCGWHAALYEHDVEDHQLAYAIDQNGGILHLPCYSDDEESDTHRGVRISVTSETERDAGDAE